MPWLFMKRELSRSDVAIGLVNRKIGILSTGSLLNLDVKVEDDLAESSSECCVGESSTAKNANKKPQIA